MGTILYFDGFRGCDSMEGDPLTEEQDRNIDDILYNKIEWSHLALVSIEVNGNVYMARLYDDGGHPEDVMDGDYLDIFEEEFIY